MAEDDQKIAREHVEANKLVQVQRDYAQEQEIRTAFNSAKPPSRFIYTIFSIFSLLIDILDFFELGADITGIGLVIVILLDVLIAGIFIALGYFASGRIQKMQTTNDSFKLRKSKTLTKRVNPLKKIFRNSVLQIIPLIDLWPWQFLAARSLYKAHQEAYEETARLKLEYEQTQLEDNSFEEAA
ncbi:MAG: hypothetical protein KW806_01460 [Candidatus Yanofskybacteria bacterium]|nr:hypothetical protein [Candidatus Yanofskybacteria bacterium]